MKNWFSWWKDGHKRFWVLLILALVIFLLIRKNNVITWVGGMFEERSQNSEIQDLEEKIKALDEGISEMQSGTDAAEQYAREKWHFHADGEDVYLVEE